MTDAARLILVRHARPADAGLRVFGSLDVELGEDGLAQAERLVERLAGENVTAVYSSPLVRARSTALPVARRLGLEPVIVPDLREIDFGELEGLTHAELEESYAGYLAWTEDPAEVVFPGGESVVDVRRRVLAAVHGIIEAHPGETVLVVSHGVTLRLVLADALRMPLAAIFRLELSHCGISVVDWFGDRAVVRSINAD